MSPLLEALSGASARGYGFINPPSPTAIDILVVAGGAVGGNSGVPGAGGGGGAGGLRNITGQAVTSGTTYTITVGGAGATSSFGGIINASAGGYGSGGGGPSDGSGPGGAGGTGNAGGYTPPEGYNGGGATDTSGVVAGGGGGAGGAGSGTRDDTNGNGGAGVTSSISGTSTLYAVGGGGGGYVHGTSNSAKGSGGGGGAYNAYETGTTGQPGIVILRYPISYGAPKAITGSPTDLSNATYRIYQFTSSGSIKF